MTELLTITINKKTHEALVELAETSGDTTQTILEKAIANYRRNLFLLQSNQAFAALRKNEVLWKEELAEREIWDGTIGDGVEEL